MSSSQNSNDDFRVFFDQAPISLWHEDFSAVKACIDQLRASGTDDLETYFSNHPNTVHEYAEMVRVIDINRATLDLYQASGKEDFLGALDKTFAEESYAAFERELLALANGEIRTSNRTLTKTLTDELVNVIVEVSIAPGFEDTWACVLVAIIDITERSEAEDKFHTITRHAPVGIFLDDADGNAIYINDSCAELVGVPAHEALNLDWVPLIHPHDRERVTAAWSDAVKKRKHFHQDYRWLHADGNVVWTQGDIAPVTDPNGTVVLFIGTLLDITDRVQAETELKHTNMALATLSACNHVLVQAEDEAQFLHDICHAITQQSGYPLAWIGRAEQNREKSVRPVAQAGFDIGLLESLKISWADTGNGAGPIATVMRTQEPDVVADIHLDPRMAPWRKVAVQYGFRSSIALPIVVGHEKFGALKVYSSEPNAYLKHEVDLLTELAQDIGYGLSRFRLRREQLQTEAALHKIEKRCHTIVMTARDAFVAMDIDGNITGWNLQAEAMFGWTREEAAGQSVAQTIVPPEARERHRQGLKRYPSSGDSAMLNQTVEVMAQRRDGLTFPAELSIVPIETDDTIEFNAFIRDISDRVAAKSDLKSSLVGTIAVISRAAEARDPYTAGHQQRVAQLARGIARELNLDSDQVDGLGMGASIHDIGKIHLPAEILAKPTRLSDTEYALIQSHPQVGYDILKDIHFPWPVADIVHQHHERLDGSGYPHGLKGDAICLEAKIVAIADVVEAISSHRPYRPAMGMELALDEIEAHRGEWYEPIAVDACLKLFREKGFVFGD